MTVKQFLFKMYDNQVPAFVIDKEDMYMLDSEPLQRGTVKDILNGDYIDNLVYKFGVGSLWDKELNCFVGCLEIYIEIDH